MSRKGKVPLTNIRWVSELIYDFIHVQSSSALALKVQPEPEENIFTRHWFNLAVYLVNEKGDPVTTAANQGHLEVFYTWIWIRLHPRYTFGYKRSSWNMLKMRPLCQTNTKSWRCVCLQATTMTANYVFNFFFNTVTCIVCADSNRAGC